MKVFIDAYLFQNLGDDLFVDILTKRYPQVDFVTYSSFYKSNSNNLKVYNNRFLNKVIGSENIKYYLAKKCDLVVYIGGSMFIEGESKPSKILKSDLKTYIIGSNFGPYQNQSYFEIHREIFKKMQDVCFRDDYSYQLFKDIACVRKASDLVFTLPVETKNVNERKALISIIECHGKNEVYKQDYEAKIVEIINKLKQDGFKVCLMSFCELQNDEKAIESILTKVKVDETYYYRGNTQEAINKLNEASFVVGSRFHANILGMLLNKAILPIAYSNKTINILKDINYQGKQINIKNIAEFDVNSLTQEDYEYHVDLSKQIALANQAFEKLDKVLR